MRLSLMDAGTKVRLFGSASGPNLAINFSRESDHSIPSPLRTNQRNRPECSRIGNPSGPIHQARRRRTHEPLSGLQVALMYPLIPLIDLQRLNKNQNIDSVKWVSSSQQMRGT